MPNNGPIYETLIGLWKATVEQHVVQLRMCHPKHEPEFVQKRDAAIKVLESIQGYKAICESHEAPHPSEMEPFA